MKHLTDLIVGMGEIGTAISGVFPEAETIDKQPKEVGKYVRVMHICFPYSTNFVNIVRAYIKEYTPDHVVIYSTVPIGTCEKIGPMIAHSPVEGRHPDLELSVRTMERWIGTDDPDTGRFFTSLFREQGIKTRVVGSSKYTEALKLLSTAEYGINLVFADYKQRVADEIDMDDRLLKDWNTAYNKLYRDLGVHNRFQKFVLDAPGGKIGGHCVVPNAKLLHVQFPSELLYMIMEMK